MFFKIKTWKLFFKHSTFYSDSHFHFPVGGETGRFSLPVSPVSPDQEIGRFRDRSERLGNERKRKKDGETKDHRWRAVIAKKTVWKVISAEDAT